MGASSVWTRAETFRVRHGTRRSFFGSRRESASHRARTGSGLWWEAHGECAIELPVWHVPAEKPVKLCGRAKKNSPGLLPPGWCHRHQERVKNDGTITAWEFSQLQFRCIGYSDQLRCSKPTIQFHASQSPLRQGRIATRATAIICPRDSHRRNGAKRRRRPVGVSFAEYERRENARGIEAATRKLLGIRRGPFPGPVGRCFLWLREKVVM